MHDQNCNCHCVPGPQRVSFLTIQLFGIFSSLSLWSVLTGRVAQSSTGVEPFRDDGGVISPGLGEQEQELKKLHAGKAAQQLKTSGSVLFTEGSLFFSKPFDGPKQKPARSCQPSVSRLGVGMGQDFAKWVGLGHLPLCMGWVGSEMGHDPWV